MYHPDRQWTFRNDSEVRMWRSTKNLAETLGFISKYLFTNRDRSCTRPWFPTMLGYIQEIKSNYNMNILAFSWSICVSYISVWIRTFWIFVYLEPAVSSSESIRKFHLQDQKRGGKYNATVRTNNFTVSLSGRAGYKKEEERRTSIQSTTSPARV